MRALIVFGRVPSPGTAKSRLRPALGGVMVDALYAAFVADILAWPLAEGTALIAAVDGAAEGVRVLAPTADVIAQPQASFGERVRFGFDRAFDAGATRAVMVGTDCPTLPADLVEDAFRALDDHAASIIPGDDGGWIALGITRPLGTALDGVTWSSTTTCIETTTALARDGRSPHVLPAWYDVDTPADVRRLHDDLRDPAVRLRAPRTAAALVSLR